MFHQREGSVFPGFHVCSSVTVSHTQMQSLDQPINPSFFHLNESADY